MSSNITNAKWKLITHSRGMKGIHEILVGYKSLGPSGMNDIFYVSPQFNLADYNFDGSVSWPEWAFQKKLLNPMHAFDLAADSPMAECAIDVGQQLKDRMLMNTAKQGLLEQSFKVIAKAMTSVMVSRLVPASGGKIANTSFASFNAAHTLVKKSYEFAVIQLLNL